MPVNPAETKFFEFLARQAEISPPPPLEEQTIDHIREGAAIFLEFAGKPADISFLDMTVPARDGYKIPIRIFNNNSSYKLPVFIMYPGCGYIINLFEANAIAASRIAKYAGIKVILVDFRLAPENPLPVPIYDAYDATKYILMHAERFNIEPNKVFIGGLSSGAHCAAVISNLVRDNKEFKIHHQILLNGCYDLTRTNHAYDAYEAEEKMCTREVTEFLCKYWTKSLEKTNPLISPAKESNLTGLPKTTIIIGEYDGLRNDSETYYEELKKSGNLVEKIVLPGQTHNTLILREKMSDGDDPASVIADVIIDNINLRERII